MLSQVKPSGPIRWSGSGSVGEALGMHLGGLERRALWRTRPYLRPYARHMAVIVFSSIMSSAFQVALPLIVKTVIDGPLRDGDRRGIVMWGLVAGLLAVLDIVMGFARRYLLAVVATQLETQLRDDLYAHLQRLDVGFHDRWQSGQLLSRATTDLAIV